MSDIIFAKTRHHYQSYTDYWRMIELSGFDTCYVNEIDPDSENTYIVTPDNDEVRNAGWPVAPRAQIIHWDLEWRLQPIEPIPGVRRYWHMDKFVADRIRVQYAPIGGHAGLREQKRSEGPWYDVAFLGYMVPRRQEIRKRIEAQYFVSPSDGWGDVRHNILSRSLVYYHSHQLEHVHGVPALRLVVAAAYQLPFMTEPCEDYGVFRANAHADTQLIVDGNPFTLINGARDWGVTLYGGVSQDLLNNHAFLRARALALHEFLCYEFTFRKSVETAV